MYISNPIAYLDFPRRSSYKYFLFTSISGGGWEPDWSSDKAKLVIDPESSGGDPLSGVPENSYVIIVFTWFLCSRANHIREAYLHTLIPKGE